MKKFLFTLLLFAAVVAKAQTNDPIDSIKEAPEKFTPVETPPTFPGGLGKLFMYFSDNEKPKGNEGTVLVSFVVDRDGSITDAKIERSLSNSADKEAIRLLSQMPKWNPGMQQGHPVRVKYTLPIKFPMK